MSFLRRTYPWTLDNLLTAIIGGVTAEAVPFPPSGAAGPPFAAALQQAPVARIISVDGARGGQPHRFRSDVDFELDADKQTLRWKTGAELPDEGTLVFVNYLPASARPVLTDIQVGSVLRTLTESTGLELARVSAQLEFVHRSGFVDTAAAAALDNVVALLGVARVRGGRATCPLELSRAPGSRGTITIPAGTRVISADGALEYETTETVTLAPDQERIRVVVRDVKNQEPTPADSLTVLPVPIAGIATLTNPTPAATSARDETDDELRARAKSFLHGSERATLGALRHAVARQGLTADIVEGASGTVTITPHAQNLPPDQAQRLLQAIEDVRPAGVQVTVAGALAPRPVNLALRLTTSSTLTAPDLRAIQQTVRARVSDFFARLPARDAASINRLVGLVLGVAGVEDVRLITATWNVDGAPVDVIDAGAGVLAIAGFPTVLGELALADPNLPVQVNVIVTRPAGSPAPDGPAIDAALSSAFAYLNTINETEPGTAPGEAERRALSYGKLLHAIALPGKPAASLQTHDDAVAAGAAPALPGEADIAPVRVQFVFVLGSGLSQVIERVADPPYQLTTAERLAAGTIDVREGA